MQNTLKNETPYDITYLGVNNMKRDALILAALIAANAIPVIGYLIEATEVEYESKLAMTLAKDIEEIIEFVQLVREGITREAIKQITSSEHLIFGALQPLQTGRYSNEECSSVEMLIQVVTLADQNGDVKFMGGSIIAEPGYASYISNMENIHDIEANTDIPWSSVEIYNDIKIVIEVFDWIRKIIDAVLSPPNVEDTHRVSSTVAPVPQIIPPFVWSYLFGDEHFSTEINTDRANDVLADFRQWVSEQDIPHREFEAVRERISVTKRIDTALKPQNRENLVRLSEQYGAIVGKKHELVNALCAKNSYGPYTGSLPITVKLVTPHGDLLPKIPTPVRDPISGQLDPGQELGGWNQSSIELKKGGGVIYFPYLVTKLNQFTTEIFNRPLKRVEFWQRQSLHIHAPATIPPDVQKAFRYEDVTQNRRRENNLVFDNTMERWGDFTVVAVGANPVCGPNKSKIGPAARSLFIAVLDSIGMHATLVDLETYVQQVQAQNIVEFNNPPGAVPPIQDLIDTQGTLVFECVYQIQRDQIIDAIKTFGQILKTRNFISDSFDDEHMSKTIRHDLDFIIEQAYSDPRYFPNIIAFVRELPLSLFLEMPSEKIRLYRKILSQMTANNHHIHPYSHIFVLATSIKYEMEHMPPDVMQQISEDGMVKISEAKNRMEQEISEMKQEISDDIILQRALAEAYKKVVESREALDEPPDDDESEAETLQRTSRVAAALSEFDANVDIERERDDIIFRWATCNSGSKEIDELNQMPPPELLNRYKCMLSEALHNDIENKKRNFQYFKKSQEIEGKFLALTKELPQPVERLIFNRNGIRLLHKDWWDGRKNYLAIEPNYADLFHLIPLEWGAFFLLYNKTSARHISGGKDGYGNRETPQTHWQPTIAPYKNAYDSRLFFRCREGNNNYLHKRIKSHNAHQSLHPYSLEIENINNVHHPLEFDEKHRTVFDKKGILWKVKNPHPGMLDDDSDDEHESPQCCIQ